MVDSREIFALALIDASMGNYHTPFSCRETAEAYIRQLHTVSNDLYDKYPHGCASEVYTRIQDLSHTSATLSEIASASTLNELHSLLYR